jgi:cytochrome c oxidase subunit 2
MTTPDVIHGFNIEGTRVNLMLIPGQITRARYRFERPGEYAILCHEYCGVGHHLMNAKVIVK